ncbi:hypothetical protein D3C71_1758760 [compost metagenome]
MALRAILGGLREYLDLQGARIDLTWFYAGVDALRELEEPASLCRRLALIAHGASFRVVTIVLVKVLLLRPKIDFPSRPDG